MWHAWERREKCTRFRGESLKERDHSEDRDVDGTRMDLGKNGWGMWSGFNWLRTGPVAGCYKCGDEPSGFGATELVTHDHNYGNSCRPILTIRSISSTSCYSLKYMPQHYGY
jgi:hypothetical protein